MSNPTFADAILDATRAHLTSSPKSVVFGLGVTDPKAIFGTTKGLVEEFGKDRIFDMPLAENAMTGVAIGMALKGYSVLFVHQRLDFYLLAMDQLVNSAAKWHMMFGGEVALPITIRLIVGRGWGQGPTHSQALHSWFAHIPGLKVVVPSDPKNAKGLLLESLRDPNPVVFVEHRWLHQMESVGDVDDRQDFLLGKANCLKQGNDITIVCMSLMVAEALRAASILKDHCDIDAEIIDLQTVRPIDWQTVSMSVKKTGRLLAIDFGHETVSVASEIIAKISIDHFELLRARPARLGLPDFATPTSFGLTKDYYPDAISICTKIATMLGKEINIEELELEKPNMHDIPGEWFKGPF